MHVCMSKDKMNNAINVTLLNTLKIKALLFNFA